MAVSETRSRGQRKQDDGSVRVWSEFGMTLPVGESMAFIKFAFGHERIAPNDNVETLKRTVADIDKFNEEEAERRIRKYTRLVSAWESDEQDQGREDTRSRAMRRAQERRAGK